MNLTWITDPHIDHLSTVNRAKWFNQRQQLTDDGLLLTGDIAESDSVMAILNELNALGRPVFFVLGNHDCYGSSIGATQAKIRDACAQSTYLKYLTYTPAFEYRPGRFLVGEDGWADGRAGDFLGSEIMLNDYQHITELTGLTSRQRLQELYRLGDEAALRLKTKLSSLTQRAPSKVVIATHVPPFWQACWYEGGNDINSWTPHFTSVAVGDVIREFAQQWRTVEIEVYCGHTHHAGIVEIEPNLVVKTGAANYGDWRFFESISI